MTKRTEVESPLTVMIKKEIMIQLKVLAAKRDIKIRDLVAEFLLAGLRLEARQGKQ
jgi:hypothetical protein